MIRLVKALAVCLAPSLAAAQTVQVQPVQVLHRFTKSAAHPGGPLVQVPGGDFYGVTNAGILRMTAAGEVTEIPRFTDDIPVGSLVLASDGGLYGTTVSRWSSYGGAATIFRFDPQTGALRTIHAFRSQTDGRRPLGGLVAVGGSLYGVTSEGPGSEVRGTIFHVVVATGEVVTDHAFGVWPTSLSTPSAPLVVGADGMLYGTTALDGTGAIYRFNPTNGVVTALHQFSLAEGGELNQLCLGADQSLYGTAARGGAEGAGTIFRYTPGTGAFQLLYSLAPSNAIDGSRPGPLVAGGDGHFYGVTSDRRTGLSTSSWTLFRLRTGAGGTFTYETLRTLDGDAHGTPQLSALTLGGDGLLYGYAGTGGPTLAGTDQNIVFGGPTGPPGPGTLFRFDPAGGGPVSNPIAFTLLHTFPLVTTWGPSTPIQAADGLLYGLTSEGGSTNRGAVYRLNPATGAVTILGEVPGALTGRTANTALLPGADGQLYGISTTFAPSPAYRAIVRVDPATGTAVFPVVRSGLIPSELSRSPAGPFYAATAGIDRYEPATGQIVTLSAYLFGVGPTPLTVTSDGQVYVLRQRPVATAVTQFMRTSLLRLTQSPPFGFDEMVLGDDITAIDRLIEGPGGAVYLGVRFANDWAVVSVNLTTGALSRICTIAPDPNRVADLSVGPDGAIYGFVSFQAQRMFRCDPATGAVTFTALPPGIGFVSAPLTSIGGLLYGAASGELDGSGGVLFRFAPGTTPPALDSDGDGLPNVWETAYGLDPFGAGPGSGAGDDPDGDGRTNAQELADGTHPRGFSTRLFAEGATGPFFRTRFDISVPDYELATVRIRFLTDTGTVVATDLVVPPRSHVALDPATLAGLAHATFSTIIESDVEVIVDRTMTWDGTGYGSHVETGIAAASPVWFFAEGSTSGDFSLFYLLQNPQTFTVTATVTYLRPFGQPPIVRTYTLPPSSRTTIVVDAETAELASTDVSASITATAPIVAERAMYYSRPGRPFAAGHESAGVTAPALEWFLAEGATGSFFDFFVLVANPNPTPAAVEVEYLLAAGGSLTKTYALAGNSRLTIFVDDEELPAGGVMKPLAATSLSAIVRSTNGVPIVVERTMWWPGPTLTPDFWYEAHNSPGATTTATRWGIGGAEIGGTDFADTYVLIANRTFSPGRARVLLFGSDGVVWVATVDVPPKSRVTVPLSAARRGTPASVRPDGRYGVVVESLGLNPVPLMVERATYASPGGTLWETGGSARAVPLR